MTTRHATALGWIRAQLRAVGTQKRARSEKAYLKSDLRFYGATMPDVRAIALAFTRDHRHLARSDLRALAVGAYHTREHEVRSVAIAVLARQRRVLEEADLTWLIDLVGRSNTWAHVDWLAVTVIGDVLARSRRPARWIEKWAKDDAFWVRRTAVLAQHDELKRERGDFELFERIAAALAGDGEFFIRKAIGWVLREVSKKRPELTYRFLAAHRDRVSRLTLQEGAKYLQATQRRSLGLPGEAAWKRREAARARNAVR